MKKAQDLQSKLTKVEADWDSDHSAIEHWQNQVKGELIDLKKLYVYHTKVDQMAEKTPWD